MIIRTIAAALMFVIVGLPVFASERAVTPKPRFLWIETGANLLMLSSRERISEMLDKAKAAGITHIIPEAKNAWGYVIYESSFAPHIRDSVTPRIWPPNQYGPPKDWFPRDHDPLAVLIEEARARGMKVHAAVNVFSEGLNRTREGVAFERPEWQSVYFVAKRSAAGEVETAFVRSGDTGTFAFVNAANAEVQNYEFGILYELLSAYKIDGIVLDRMRWWNYYADFSAENRLQFETFIGRRVERWPDDVLSYAATEKSYKIVRGPLWREWQGWRAQVLYRFSRAITTMARLVRPGIEIANYVGGWYPYYWREGVNWGAAGHDPGFDWINPVWIGSGIAEFFDYLMVGAYYPEVFESESVALSQPAWMSVEGVAKLAREVTMGKTRIINSLILTDFVKNPERLREAMKVSDALTDGVMLFDLVFLEQFRLWNLLGP